MSRWQILPLRALCQLQGGALVNASRTLQDAMRLPYLSTRNVQEGMLDLSQLGELQIERQHAARHRLQDGDLLLVKSGESSQLGRCAIWLSELPHCLHQNHVQVLRCDAAQILPEFLQALLMSSYGRAFFARFAKSSTRLASLSGQNLAALPLPLPPVAQQQPLAALWQTLAQQIRQAQQRIANSLAQRQRLRAQLLPGPDSPGCTEYSLSQLCRLAHSLSPAARAQLADFHYVEIGDLEDGEIRPGLQRYPAAQAPARARYALHAGAVLLGMSRPETLRIARVGPQHIHCIASNAFAVLLPGPLLDADYLFHALHSRDMLQQFAKGSSGSSFPQLNLKRVQALRLTLPPLAQQQQIAQCLDLLQQRLRAERRDLQLLLQLRSELLERMLQPGLQLLSAAGLAVQAGAP